MSQRETVLAALLARLEAIPAAKVLRNEFLPEKVPPDGLVILRDGDPGEPEVTLSPVTYYWQHRAELEVIVTAPTGAARDAKLDAILEDIGAAITSDPTLNGWCDLATPQAPQPISLQIDGAPPFKGVTVGIDLFYATASALG